MRILWLSNGPWCNSGYGVVTAEVCRRIKQHHEVAIFAQFGLKGGMLTWEGIPVYPNAQDDYGNTSVALYAQDWGADVVISLLDVWIFNQDEFSKVNWVPYFPIDHKDMPPIVHANLKARKAAITMSRYGHARALEKGVDSFCIPHGVDTKVYTPNEEYRRLVREAIGLKEKFLVGTVATNNEERKNYEGMLNVFARFHKEHPDSMFYCHCDPRFRHGIQNMPSLCIDLGIKEAVIFPDTIHLRKGMTAQEMACLYNAFDVFLLLSKGEGFGIPILEAQSCGVPVIVTDATAMSELCFAGWKIPVKRWDWTYQLSRRAIVDEDAALKRLEEMYGVWREDKPSYRWWQEKARREALAYDWDTVVERDWLPALAALEERFVNKKAVVEIDFPVEQCVSVS